MTAPNGRKDSCGPAKLSHVLDSLAGHSAMGELVRRKDWGATALGPIEQWPQSLLTAVSFMLNSSFPFVLFWGDSHSILYNDRYIPIFGGKHPTHLGRPGCEPWAEIWDVIKPMLDSAREGVATWSEDQFLEVNRHGYLEECYFTFSYSPIRVEDGSVGGIMTPVTETTQRVLGERRLRLLRELSAQTGDVQSEAEACDISAKMFTEHCTDVTFALIYMVDATGKRLELKGKANVEDEHPAAVAMVSLEGDENLGWPVAEVMKQRAAFEVNGLGEKFGRLHGGTCEHMPTQNAICMPLEGSSSQEPIGVVIFGLNPRRRLDAEYKGFLELTTTQLTSAILRGKGVMEERKRLEALAAMDRAKSVFFRYHLKGFESVPEALELTVFLCSNISHEYRTPLTLILGPVTELLNDSSLTQSQLDKVRLIERNGQRLHKLVNAVLDFSKLEAGRMDATYRPTDISQVTANVASMFRSAMEKGGLTYTVDAPALGEMVYIDVDMWEKVLFNLLSNAFKFSTKGGVSIRLYKNKTSVVLQVSDTGCGVPPEEVPRLFERFHRCDTSHGRSMEGTGIGLSLVNELVKLHGGTISAESELNVGTTFTVTIPLGKAHLSSKNVVHEHFPSQDDPLKPGGPGSAVKGESSIGRAFVQESLRWTNADSSNKTPSLPRASGAAASVSNSDLAADERSVYSDEMTNDKSGSSENLKGPAQNGKLARIVLADDNADMREYVSSLLAKFAIVHVMHDGLQAYRSIMDNPPDLILSDVMMPKMGGFELLKKVKSHPRTKHIPFVLLSARAGEEAQVEGLQAGADDYLVKPFSAKELRARVKTQLAMGSMRGELERMVQVRTRDLSELTRQYELLATTTPVGICRSDINGDIVYVNKMWWKMLRRDPEIDSTTEWNTWLAEHNREVTLERLGQTIVDRQPLRIDVDFKTRDGEVFTLLLTSVFDPGNEQSEVGEIKNPGGFYSALVDVSEERRLEKERHITLQSLAEEQRRRAEEADENRQQQELFVDTICHEIRNPLSGIVNNNDLLKMNLKKRWSVLRNVVSAVTTWKAMFGLHTSSSTTAPGLMRTPSNNPRDFDMAGFMKYLDEQVIPASRTTWLEDQEASDAIAMCTSHQSVITDDVLLLSKMKHNKVSVNPIICAPEVVISRVLKMFR
ncbi:uncharacterized protein EV422DRAFT_194247 [Fimicolochytrium jonesii]|uniref:uncharacterized protein n=1 Tax=Fimicolochytrium jonesii TaxID=1396493 RepID=UPI0022FF1F13|nr:uncharacterized protein EV422DRAFT_194247 [Fimicolochytrium jonesii]KAI8818204.1 hypothetical protein EV422DRAFT_194247 [Fimicolochytrium jonesii]